MKSKSEMHENCLSSSLFPFFRKRVGNSTQAHRTRANLEGVWDILPRTSKLILDRCDNGEGGGEVDIYVILCM